MHTDDFSEIQEALCQNQEELVFLDKANRELPKLIRVKQISFILRDILFPGYYAIPSLHCAEYFNHLQTLKKSLKNEIRLAIQFQQAEAEMENGTTENVGWAEERLDLLVHAYLEKLPAIQRSLATDIEAIYQGDPAAKSREEIILSYLSFQAIVMYRLAHGLWELDIPLLPRMLTELAHKQTGIDIHPGAQIGDYFCIDHGTGVVIGETAVIGNHVKVYQGVTLGALSLRKGRGLVAIKRHPTIEDDVTLYANSTILGGDTTIGQGCVIGGGAFITSSIPSGKRVFVPSQQLSIEEDC